MSKKKITEMICILDKSGSMYGKELDTIGSYNQMLKEQKEQPGEAYITTAFFSDHCQTVYRHMPIQEARPLTEKDYFTAGNTALFDAIGKVLTQTGQILSDQCGTCEENVLVFIITDGMENASKNYDLPSIRRLIREKQDKGWEFLFLGTDMEILDMAQSTGIKKGNTFQYSRDSKGIRTGYQAAGHRFSEIRKKTK